MADNKEHFNIEKLKDAENYNLWKFQIDILFKSEDLMGIVDGSQTFPEGEEKEDAQKNWMKKDAKVQKLLVTTIDKSVLLHCMYKTSGKEMYDSLKEVFERDTDTMKCNLLGQFYQFQYDSKKSVADNIAALQSIVFRLRALKEQISETMIISKVLLSLPSKFSHFASAWESAAVGERTLANLNARLSSEELKVGGASERDNNTVFKAFSKKLSCRNCGKVGHFARDCWSKNKDQRDEPKQDQAKAHTHKKKCEVCGRSNHETANCRYRVKQQEAGNSESSSRSNEKKGESSHIAFNTVINGTKFYVDSGASKHLCKELDSLQNVTKDETIITTANNSKMYGNLSGTVKGSQVDLVDVSYVPELSENLLSVNKITQNNGVVVFDQKHVNVYYDGEVVMQGDKTAEGMYVVDVKNAKQTNSAMMMTQWHEKMGHLGFKNLAKLKNMADGIEFKAEDKSISDCETCIKAKHIRTPFSGHLPEGIAALDIIHTDVCKIETESYCGEKYFITFLDDFTHYAEVHTMVSKEEVCEKVQEFVTRVENQLERKVKVIKSDNGTEFKNAKLLDWCASKGIVMNFTTPYSPSLNGKAERLNRTLCEKMRAMLFQSKVEKELWNEALRAACYVTNRSPTANQDKTPIELWTGKRPNLENIKVFGSPVYIKTLTYVKKLEERSRKFRFVGYSNPGYRCWDSETRKIHISRDVQFVTTQCEEEPTEETIVRLDSENSDDEDDVSDEPEEDSDAEDTGNNPRDTEEDSQNRYGFRDRNRIQPPNHLNDYVLLTYQEALKAEDKDNWLLAINEEKRALAENNTWSYVNAEDAGGKKVLSTKWVMKVKPNGAYKARLVVRGFEQEDYAETYSPVVNVTSLRILLAVSAVKKFKMTTFDVSTAFLNAPLEDEVYIKVPEGYKEKKGMICKLNRSLYGLKQAPLCWNTALKKTLKDIGLSPLKNDPCVFKNSGNSIYLGIYVDDGFLIGESNDEIEEIIGELKKIYKINVGKGSNEMFLGLEIKKEENGIHVSQEKYVKDMLKKYKMQDCNGTKTPIVASTKESIQDNAEEIKFPYREAVGSLIYLSTKTRPDVSFAVNYESRSVEKPTQEDLTQVKRTMRYLKDTAGLGILYKNSGNLDKLTVFSDSDYAGDLKTRRSTTGYICMLNGAPIAWCSRRQPIVALSSTEAEFIAAAEAVKEVIFLKSLIEELLSTKIDIELNVDNTSAIAMIKSGKFNVRSKHIDTRYYFISEKFEEKLFHISHCPTGEQIADCLTKALPHEKFRIFRDALLC